MYYVFTVEFYIQELMLVGKASVVINMPEKHGEKSDYFFQLAFERISVVINDKLHDNYSEAHRFTKRLIPINYYKITNGQSKVTESTIFYREEHWKVS